MITPRGCGTCPPPAENGRWLGGKKSIETLKTLLEEQYYRVHCFRTDRSAGFVLQNPSPRKARATRKRGKWVLHGFPSLGSGDKTGVWEEQEGAVEISAQDVKDFYQACISLRQLRPNFEDRLLDAVISEIESDAELGRLTEISVEELRAVPAYAFPKEEATKVRVIIDARFHNQWANLTERLTLYGKRWITQTIAL